IITDVMSNLPALLIGAFLIERFFGIPGIGREVIIAVERSDFPDQFDIYSYEVFRSSKLHSNALSRFCLTASLRFVL
ncbi:hypothetical protein IAF33_19425, partial [Acinetobacter baumannii]|nr:hypothetical protein [Acinetobacter baumannii]